MLWSVKTPVSLRDNTVGYIDTVRHARDYKVKYVVATSAFFIELCQEVVVKGFNKGWFINTRCAVNGVPGDSWQISQLKLPYCRTCHKLHAENYRIHSSNLGLHWSSIAKTE